MKNIEVTKKMMILVTDGGRTSIDIGAKDVVVYDIIPVRPCNFHLLISYTNDWQQQFGSFHKLL